MAYIRQPILLVSVSVFFLFCSAVMALPFSIDALEGEFESSISFKNNWSAAKPNSRFIGRSNGGSGYSSISDNGRLNFKRGDSFSRLLKAEHKLHLKYGETGLVISGQYWYDFVEKNQRQSFANISDRGRYLSSRAAAGQWQEAYFYQHYQLAGRSGTMRLGRQVLNWGEEQFIEGGINAINPIDNREGWRSDLNTRATRTPIGLLSFSQQLTDILSTELFYQLDWRPAVDSNCGSFFSNSDITTHGCNTGLRVLRPNSSLSAADLAQLADVNINAEGVLVRREKDRRTKSSGQFGLSLHYYFEPLKTDLGFYFINYHSRTGFINGRRANQADITHAGGLGALAPEWLAGRSSYFLQYPENIRLYGFSFAKDITADMIWRGELSYRPNMPVQINQIELYDRTLGQGAINLEPSQKIKGYERKKVTQLQTSLTKTANEIMGAKEFKLTSALGMTYISGLGNTPYGRDAVFGRGSAGLTSRHAWGYRIQGQWQYLDVLPRLTLKPSINWLHDVKGYSPSNEAVFIEGRKAISLGVEAEYLKTYTLALNYTDFFGGRYNRWKDRDFMSLELGIKF